PVSRRQALPGAPARSGSPSVQRRVVPELPAPDDGGHVPRRAARRVRVAGARPADRSPGGAPVAGAVVHADVARAGLGADRAERHPTPAARAIRSRPAATAVPPIARATRSPAGATRSAVMAVGTRDGSIIATIMTPRCVSGS